MVSMLGLAGEAAEVARKSTNTWHALRYLCSVLTAKCASSLRRCVPKLREVLSCWNVSHAGPMRFTSAVKESSASLRAASLRALVVLGSCGLTGAGDMGWGCPAFLELSVPASSGRGEWKQRAVQSVIGAGAGLKGGGGNGGFAELVSVLAGLCRPYVVRAGCCAGLRCASRVPAEVFRARVREAWACMCWC